MDHGLAPYTIYIIYNINIHNIYCICNINIHTEHHYTTPTPYTKLTQSEFIDVTKKTFITGA